MKFRFFKGFASVLHFVALMSSAITMAATTAQSQTHEMHDPPVDAPTVLRGRQALADGDLRLAEEIATQVLIVNQNDSEALILRALLLQRLNLRNAALNSVTEAWRHARSPISKFESAFLAANILYDDERYLQSQLWLRRASEVAPNATYRSRVARAYRLVQLANPLGVNLSFSFSPSNNVNNGSESLEIDIGGLPFELHASKGQLGGVEGLARASLSYRIIETRFTRTDLLADVSLRRVWLNSDAQRSAPSVQNSDLSFESFVVGGRHQRLIWPDLGPTTFTGLVGHSWYGGQMNARWTDVGINQSVKLGATSNIQYSFQVRSEERLEAPLDGYEAIGASIKYFDTLGTRNAYSLGVWAREYSSNSATVDATAAGISATLSLHRIGPVEPRFALLAERREYRKWAITADGRVDQMLDLQIDAIWPDINYYGFVPETSFVIRRTWSNVDLYDRNEMSLGLGLVSRF